MILSFTLSMPNNNSWDGKWSGEDDLYVRTKNFTAKQIDISYPIREKGYFHYNFGDGWSAGIDVKEITSQEGAKLRKKSKGFCGYDWMIGEIIQYGEILGPNKRPKKEKVNE